MWESGRLWVRTSPGCIDFHHQRETGMAHGVIWFGLGDTRSKSPVCPPLFAPSAPLPCHKLVPDCHSHTGLERPRTSPTASQPDPLQDLLDARTRHARPDADPYLIWEPLALGQHAPVRRVIGLEPLEVIDLVPLVLGSVYSFDGLAMERGFMLAEEAEEERRPEQLTKQSGTGAKRISLQSSITGRLPQCR